jgi:hypothetical protein
VRSVQRRRFERIQSLSSANKVTSRRASVSKSRAILADHSRCKPITFLVTHAATFCHLRMWTLVAREFIMALSVCSR